MRKSKKKGFVLVIIIFLTVSFLYSVLMSLLNPRHVYYVNRVIYTGAAIISVIFFIIGFILIRKSKKYTGESKSIKCRVDGWVLVILAVIISSIGAMISVMSIDYYTEYLRLLKEIQK